MAFSPTVFPGIDFKLLFNYLFIYFAVVAPEDQVRQIHLQSIYLTQLQREKVRSLITPKGLFLTMSEPWIDTREK